MIVARVSLTFCRYGRIIQFEDYQRRAVELYLMAIITSSSPEATLDAFAEGTSHGIDSRMKSPLIGQGRLRIGLLIN